MARRYDNCLLESMISGQYIETVQGVEVLVKPIPEGGEDGDMDPRIYQSMKRMPIFALVQRLTPKSKKPQTILEKILPLRKMFGEYKGERIADEGVQVEHDEADSADGHKVPVRIYTRSSHGEGLPVFVYYHGGGFFGGSADIVEQMCKLMVQQLDCVAVNVEYRLCPENSYPAPLDDCFAATQWAFANADRFGGDRTKLVVSGDSAGGNLAAAVTLRDREERTGMVRLQVLIYPAVNISGAHTEFYKGIDHSLYHKSRKHKKVLDAVVGMMSGMLGGASGGNMLEEVYLQGKLDMKHVYASPILDDMHDLPPTMLIFGEHDFLVFEDFAYARTLTKAGVPLRTIVYRGIGHGFADQIGVAPQAEDCIKEIASYMSKMLEL